MNFFLIGFIGLIASFAVFLISFRKAKKRFARLSIKAAPICWGAYLAWEILAFAVGWNIRIDLLVIYPTLLAVSSSAVISGILSLFEKNQAEEARIQ